MSQLPLSDKNSYLVINIANESIISKLAYAHYEIDREYFLTDLTFFHSTWAQYSSAELKRFLIEYFVALEHKWNWSILEISEELSEKLDPEEILSTQIKHFSSEGVGVSGIKFQIEKSIQGFQAILVVIRGLFPEAKIEVFDKQARYKLMTDFASKYEYDNLLLVDLNLTKFEIFRVTKKMEKVSLANINEGLFDKKSLKVHWKDKQNLVDIIKSTKLKAFMSLEISDARILNQWANFVYNPVQKSSNKLLADILRSYCTGQLLSLFNDQADFFKDSGKPGKNMLLISGDLTKLIANNDLLLAVLDGLQLRGSYDLFVDRDSLFVTYGKNLTLGIGDNEFIPSLKMYPIFTKVLIPEIPGHEGERKVIFSGRWEGSDIGSESIYAVTPRFTDIELPEHSKLLVEGDFVKGAYVDGLEKVDFISDERGVKYSRILIDGRFKPVIYSTKKIRNKNKLEEWFSND